jgi:hypothetical protein
MVVLYEQVIQAVQVVAVVAEVLVHLQDQPLEQVILLQQLHLKDSLEEQEHTLAQQEIVVLQVAEVLQQQVQIIHPLMVKVEQVEQEQQLQLQQVQWDMQEAAKPVEVVIPVVIQQPLLEAVTVDIQVDVHQQELLIKVAVVVAVERQEAQVVALRVDLV